MSFYERYLAPGDLRARQQHQSNSSTSSQTNPGAPVVPPNLRPKPAAKADDATRQRRKDALLYGGVVFTFLSMFITRRALIRRRTYPKAFEPSNGEAPKVNGGLEAVEALGLATLNVSSLAMAAAGGLMTYFDIADIEDMRDVVRQGQGYDVYGGRPDADKELEDWVKDVMTKKDEEGGGFDLKGSIAGKLQELAELEKRQAEQGGKGLEGK